MTIREMFGVLRRRWLAFVICFVVGLGIAVGVALQAPLRYQSTSRILVATPDVSQNALVPPGGVSVGDRAASYATMATGTAVTDRVMLDVGWTKPRTVLLAATKVTVLPGSTLIQIAVTDSDPNFAQRIAQAYAVELVAFVTKVNADAGTSDTKVTLTITDPATVPTERAPRGLASQAALGAVGGIVLGIVVLWILEYLDTSVRRREDLDRLADAPVLASIPASAARLVSPEEPEAEIFRTLRTAVGFLLPKDSPRVLIVSGVTRGVGASTVAANLARSLSWADQRVLLIDADFHHPALASILAIPADGPGLGDVLSGTVDLSQAIRPAGTERLDLLTSGRPPADPTERLQSAAMTALIAKAGSDYDAVVVDASPALTANDAVLLSAAAAGAVLVARYGATRRQDVLTARGSFDMANAALIGTVFTDVPMRLIRTDSSYRAVSRAAASTPQP